VHAGVALHLNPELPAQARSSLAAIKQASNQALGELRSMLDVLRNQHQQAPQSPTATLARLDALVAQVGAAGLEVRTQIQGKVRGLPDDVDATAFWIVQEALTNVIRHAGPATATVRVANGDRDLTVEINDDGHGPPVGNGAGTGKGCSACENGWPRWAERSGQVPSRVGDSRCEPACPWKDP
jgi:signal transduction histidine kinase